MNDELAKIVIQGIKNKKYQLEDTSYNQQIKAIDNFIDELEKRKKDLETLINLPKDKTV